MFQHWKTQRIFQYSSRSTNSNNSKLSKVNRNNLLLTNFHDGTWESFNSFYHHLDGSGCAKRHDHCDNFFHVQFHPKQNLRRLKLLITKLHRKCHLKGFNKVKLIKAPSKLSASATLPTALGRNLPTFRCTRARITDGFNVKFSPLINAEWRAWSKFLTSSNWTFGIGDGNFPAMNSSEVI